MEQCQDYPEEEYEGKQKPYSSNYHTLNADNKKSNQTSKVSYSSKYNQNKNSINSKKTTNQTKKENQNNEYKKTNQPQNTKKDNNYSYSSRSNQPNNSSLNKQLQNKYVTSFNSSSKRNDLSNATISSDGVLSGYTDNCGFYVSGSSDLNSKTTNKNLHNNNNRENRATRSNRTYESKTQVINLSDYRKNEVINDSTNKHSKQKGYENNYKNNNYNKTNVNSNMYNKNNDNYYGNYKYSYNDKKNQNSTNDYSRRSHYETEPNIRIRHYNHRKKSTENDSGPFVPERNITNREPQATIKSINNNLNNPNNIRRVYNSSTNTSYEENNKNNYSQTIIETRYESRRRNNTPNISSRYGNRDNSYNNYHYNITERNTIPEIKSIPNRYNRSEIPHNKGYRYKTNTEIQDNIINNSQRYYQPRYTLNQRNVNSSNDTNINKNRYNFLERPKSREYGTKTEVYSYSKNNYSKTLFNNNERDNLYEPPTQRHQTSSYKNNEPYQRYGTRSVSTAIYNRGPRKYGIQTETISSNRNTYTRVNEYEVTDINSFRKQQNQRDNYSVEKNYERKREPINLLRSLYNTNNNNKKEYTVFEKSLKNIRDNQKDIEKDNRRNKYNNHQIYVSTNITKDKKIYKTSTQKEAFRPYRYTLSSLNEYEVPGKKYQRYGKNDDDKYKRYDDKNKNLYKNININKNNYFNAMKNLEEEIEVDDENDYLPLKPLAKINIKTKDNNYKYDINKTTQPKDEKKNKTNYIINIKREDKTKDKKDNNKDRHSTGTGEYKNYNISDNKNNPPKNTNYNYFESTYNKKSNKITSITAQKAKNDKDKTTTKTEITNINININKKQEEKPRPKYPQNNPQHIHQIPTQIKRPLETKKPVQQYKATQQQITAQQKPLQEPQKSTQQQKTARQDLTNQMQKPQIQQTEQKSSTLQKKNKKQHKPIQRIKPQLNLKNPDSKINTQNQIKTKQLQEANNEDDNKEEEIQENEKDDSDKNKKISKYSSYFGDSNNNYHEIKGVSSTKKEENEEDEENEQNNSTEEVKKYDQPMQLVRNVTFGIQSENLCVPAETEYDKDKEADEQIIEEDEINDDNYNENEENEGDLKNRYNDNDEEGELGDDNIDENENEENDDNEMAEEYEDIENNVNEDDDNDNE